MKPNSPDSRSLPTVSVIVPCYNYGHFLPECIASILSQDGVKVDVLIIDDASPDNTSEVATELARKHSRITFLRHASNKGHITTYNEGIEWATGDYLLIISADDYLLPNALSRAANLMNVYPQVGFAFGKAIDLIDHAADRQTDTIPNAAVAKMVNGSEWSILDGVEFFKLIESSGSVNIVRTPTVVVRTELQKRLGGYRPELPHSGDMEMWLRLAAHASVGVLNAYQAIYRLHGRNMQMNYYKEKSLADIQQRKAAIDYVFENFGDSVPDYKQLHRRLLKHLGRETVGYASHAFNDNEMELSEQLAKLALSLDPKIKRSIPWMFLKCKRYMGTRLSHALVPVITLIRQTAIRLFG